MGRVLVLGERSRVGGFALAGAEVVAAEDPAAVIAAWAALEPDVAVVVLTPAAADALGPLLDEPPRPDRPLVVPMPAAPSVTGAPSGTGAPGATGAAAAGRDG